MEAKRYIGIDLHRNCFTACLRSENGRDYLREWKLEDIGKFVAKLRPTDQVAVEVTGHTRLFHDAVAPHVERVMAVNPRQFQVITHSVPPATGGGASRIVETHIHFRCRRNSGSIDRSFNDLVCEQLKEPSVTVWSRNYTGVHVTGWDAEHGNNTTR